MPRASLQELLEAGKPAPKPQKGQPKPPKEAAPAEAESQPETRKERKPYTMTPEEKARRAEVLAKGRAASAPRAAERKAVDREVAETMGLGRPPPFGVNPDFDRRTLEELERRGLLTATTSRRLAKIRAEAGSGAAAARPAALEPVPHNVSEARAPEPALPARATESALAQHLEGLSRRFEEVVSVSRAVAEEQKTLREALTRAGEAERRRREEKAKAKAAASKPAEEASPPSPAPRLERSQGVPRWQYAAPAFQW